MLKEDFGNNLLNQNQTITKIKITVSEDLGQSGSVSRLFTDQSYDHITNN